MQILAMTAHLVILSVVNNPRIFMAKCLKFMDSSPAFADSDKSILIKITFLNAEFFKNCLNFKYCKCLKIGFKSVPARFKSNKNAKVSP